MIDDDECLLLYDLNRSKNLDVPCHSYEKFNLDSLSENESKSEFRFNKRDIYRLCDFFEISEEIRGYNGMVFDKEEASCIFVKKFAYLCRYQDLMLRFGQKAVSQLSMISNQVQSIIYENWGFLMRNMNQNWLSRRMFELFAEVVHTKQAPLDNCWGFVDGTTRPVCRPGKNQRLLYNSHKRYHYIKFQWVVAPNGLIANLFAPLEVKWHDSGMVANSGLLNQPQQHWFDTGGRPLCIFRDPAYPLRVHLQSGFRGTNITREEELWNSKMSSVRQAVKWIFGDIVNFCKLLDFKKNFKIGLSPIDKMYIVSALLHNGRSCFYGTITSKYFECEPPITEEYFTHW